MVSPRRMEEALMRQSLAEKRQQLEELKVKMDRCRKDFIEETWEPGQNFREQQVIAIEQAGREYVEALRQARQIAEEVDRLEKELQ